MIETPRLIIADRQFKDIPTEVFYLTLHPELRDLDPTVGESRGAVFYSIFTKDVNRHIGICCLYNPTTSTCELGVRIFNPDYWNEGYGSEVVNALCEYVFNFSLIITILAKTPSHNSRAIRCYEKCQFTQYSQAVLDEHDMVFMRRQRCLLQKS